MTVVPRGRALGLSISLPEKDVYSRAKSWLEDRIAIMYGGYSAERIVYGETTTGTAQDIRQATDFARKMVCEWGMAEQMGPVAYGQEEEPIFIGKEIAQHKDYSENTAMRIDEAIKKILESALAPRHRHTHRASRPAREAGRRPRRAGDSRGRRGARSFSGFAPREARA